MHVNSSAKCRNIRRKRNCECNGLWTEIETKVETYIGKESRGGYFGEVISLRGRLYFRVVILDSRHPLNAIQDVSNFRVSIHLTS